MTLEMLLREGKERLAEAGVADAALDARYLLLDVWEMNLAAFLTCRGRELSPDGNREEGERIRRYRELIEQRAGRTPLQQLTGSQEFMGLPFRVNAHVLIPRQDTETLVELVLKEQAGSGGALLDMCTGSGCIAVSLAKLGDFSRVVAADISREALEVADENRRAILGDEGERLLLAESDMFAQIGRRERFDVITSNPPYIPSQVIEGLEPEVRDHEPRLALDGAADGLKFYRILADGCREHLIPGGYVYMEIGWDQAEDVKRIFEDHGYKKLTVTKDMAGLDRVVRAVWPGKGEENHV